MAYEKQELESIIGLKKALKLAKEVEGAKYLFIDQNAEWVTSETYLYDATKPKVKFNVEKITIHPENGKNLGWAGDDLTGMSVIPAWDIKTGEKMFDFKTPESLKESKSLVQYMDFLLESKLDEKTSEDLSENILKELKKIGFVIRDGFAYCDFISDGKVSKILVVEPRGDNSIDIKIYGNKINDEKLIDEEPGVVLNDDVLKNLKAFIKILGDYVKAETLMKNAFVMISE